MVEIDAKQVKILREKTGAGMMDCKKALVECEGDFDKAVDYLRVKGLAAAKKKAGRSANEGVIFSYIHQGDKLGVMLEVNCETDFVARNEDFQNFVKDIAMHIAAADPKGLAPEDFDESDLEKEKHVLREQAIEAGKPENIVDKIVEGRMKKFYEENCLLLQPYVKDPDMSVQEYLDESISRISENIVIRRFVRFQLGEDLE